MLWCCFQRSEIERLRGLLADREHKVASMLTQRLVESRAQALGLGAALEPVLQQAGAAEGASSGGAAGSRGGAKGGASAAVVKDAAARLVSGRA